MQRSERRGKYLGKNMTSCRDRLAYALLSCGIVLLTLAFPADSVAATTQPAVHWDVMSDTWVATDDLGRQLPMHAEVGQPRPGKFVGIFYFLWLGRHGEQGPFDISRILAADSGAMRNPQSPLWGPLHAPHHWGESIFDYYVSDDPSVLRKHAQMLSDAGVDVVIFDVTNQLTYPQSWRALCRVFDEVRREGNAVPRIAFLCPFWEPKKVVLELWDELYGKGLYPELWFKWEGKPLILADPAMLAEAMAQTEHDAPAALAPGHSLGQTFTANKPFDSVSACLPTWETRNAAVTMTLYRTGPGGARIAQQRVTNIADNAWATLELKSPEPPGVYYLELTDPAGQVGWWSLKKDALAGGQSFADAAPVAGDRTLRVNLVDDRMSRIRQFFTFRKPQPDYFTGPRGPGEWGWLEVHPQHVFYKTPGVPEQMTVGVAQNAVDGKLSILSNPRSHGRSHHEGRQPGPDGRDFTGRNFAEQWKRALEVDPPFIFITGWNEWIAGRFNQDSPFYGDGPVTFVDQFNREYSRDIEPMKGGHGDTFYYQMIGQIRRYKGARSIPQVVSKPIQVDGKFDDWRGVEPEYRDTIGDPVHRDYRGWGKGSQYINRTGRNDIVAAKVSADRDHLYFYVRTRERLTPDRDPNWMMLFLDLDCDASTGWLGYEAVVGRSRDGTGRVSLQRHVGRGYQWEAVADVSYRTADNELELSIPLAALGMKSIPAALDFKWADNIQQTGECSDFTLNGDAAPNDRYNYRACFPGRQDAHQD